MTKYPDEKIALVTGSSSGIGAAVAGRLLKDGWHVVGVARRPATIGHPLYRHVKLDLSNIDAVAETIRSAIAPIVKGEPWTRVGLVNNAALGGQLGPTEKIDPRGFAQMLAVNVTSPVYLMGVVAQCAPHDAPVRIVNVSSGAGVRAFPGLAAYGATKAALRMAGIDFAAELDSPQRSALLAPDVAILSYEPGVVDTEMQTESRNTPASAFPWVQVFKDFKANGMLVTPDKPAAEIVAFLASDGQARFTEKRFGS